MIERYTEEQLKDKKFLFVSYSHNDADVVENAAKYLLNKGVRLWYDKDLHNGDDWQKKVKNILENTSCMGVIFFNSKNSFASDAVNFERGLVINRRKENNSEFKVFLVHIGNYSTMQIVKQVLEALPDDAKAIESVMGTERISRIADLFSDKVMYSFINSTPSEEGLCSVYNSIEETTKEVIDKNYVKLDSVHDIIAEKNKEKDNTKITIKLGSWQEAPLTWRFFRCDGDDWVFLLDSILCKRNGGAELLDWLNGEFKENAFNPSEKAILEQPLRLLSMEEIEKTEFGYLIQSDQSDHWWLSDTNGTRQATVRPDGTIYQKGFHNKNVEKGVRPVIVIKREQTDEIFKK